MDVSDGVQCWLIFGDIALAIIALGVGAMIRDSSGRGTVVWARARLLQWTCFLAPIWFVGLLLSLIPLSVKDFVRTVKQSDILPAGPKAKGDGELSIAPTSGGEVSRTK